MGMIDLMADRLMDEVRAKVALGFMEAMMENGLNKDEFREFLAGKLYDMNKMREQGLYTDVDHGIYEAYKEVLAKYDSLKK